MILSDLVITGHPGLGSGPPKRVGQGMGSHGMISFQIGRGRWRISRGRGPILPFRRERGENVGLISHEGD